MSQNKNEKLRLIAAAKVALAKENWRQLCLLAERLSEMDSNTQRESDDA